MLREKRDHLTRLLEPLVAAAFLAVLTACETAPPASTQSASAPAVKTMEVNGARLPWVEQGRGATVVYVHGALADYRVWDANRAALAGSGYRTIAYTQRYFGTDPWSRSWPPFGVQTHADDLAAFIRGLGAGPVHLVAWSYAGHTALTVALKHPELVKSAFVFEPAVPSYVTDAAELKTFGDDANAFFGPIVQAIQAGDNNAAARLLMDGVAEQKGYFDALPPDVQAAVLEKARTMPLLMADKAPPISCAELGKIKPPVAMSRGATSRPFFSVVTDAGARCMPAQKHIVGAKQNHMWPLHDVAGFNAAVLGFLKGQ